MVHEHVYGFGQSFFTSGEAVTKAIGEFLERYYLAVDWKNNTFVSTKKKLGRRALNLENTPCYLESQKKIEESFITKTDLDDSAFGWVQAKSVFGLFKTYVPAQRVFWMPQQDAKLGTLNHATSNGNAGHFSKQMTILSSIYELVERDGFMYYWLCKISPTQIDTSSIESPAMAKQREFITRYKLQVSFFDITTAVNIPSVLCVVVDTSDANDPKVSIGASAGFNVDKLIDGSFMEALVVQRHHTANRAKDIAFDTASHFDDKDFDGKELNNRIYFWRGKEAMRCLQFMYDGKKTTYTKFKEQYEVKVFTSVKVEYKFVKKLFSGLIQEFGSAYTPYIYSVKDRFLSTIGYHVTSAVVMGLYPLYMVEYKVCLDIRDIAHWKETSKEKGVVWKGIVQNTHPHPFP
jgi:thiazole/oxazole-forming peptide maturase SagD family component